jgi:hypothetical protein
MTCGPRFPGLPSIDAASAPHVASLILKMTPTATSDVGFDFAQRDAVAANLYWVIEAAEKFESAVQ